MPARISAALIAWTLVSSAIPAGGNRTADASVPAAVAAVLRDIRAADTNQFAVSEEDGRFLRLLVVSHRVERALEIGAASGYSAIWIGLGLRATGGHLTTIEYDSRRASEAAENIRRAGLSDVVRVISGDGFVEIPKVAAPFDFVFMDAWKRDYKRFFDLVLPRLELGGLFVAHNVVNKRNEMAGFLSAIHNSPQVMTAIVSPSGEGMSISLRLK